MFQTFLLTLVTQVDAEAVESAVSLAQTIEKLSIIGILTLVAGLGWYMYIRETRETKRLHEQAREDAKEQAELAAKTNNSLDANTKGIEGLTQLVHLVVTKCTGG